MASWWLMLSRFAVTCAAPIARRTLTPASGASLLGVLALIALLAQGVALAAPNPLGLKVANIALTSEVRVGRTTYEYTYRVTVENHGTQTAGNVMVTVTAPGMAGTMITDGSLNIGSIAAGRGATSKDTFTLVQDRLFAFDRSRLVFDFSYEIGDVVPDVAGLTLVQARAAIVAAGYRSVDGNEIPAHSDTVAAGLAIGTQPPAGTVLARSSEVRIVVSTGPEATSGLRLSINPASVVIPQDSGRFVTVDIARSSALPPNSIVDVAVDHPPPGIDVNALVFTPDLVSGRLAIRASRSLAVGSEFDLTISAATSGANAVRASSSLHVKVTPSVPSSRELIRTARAQGRLDLPTSLLFRMYATVGDARLPLEFRGEGSTEDPTLPDEIESNQAALPAAVAATLHSHLVRPTDPGSFWNMQAADLPPATGLSVAKASPSSAVPLLEQATCPTSGAKVAWIHQRSARSPVRVWAQCVLGFTDNNARAEAGIRYGIEYVDAIFPPMTAMMGPPLVDQGAGGLDPDPNIDVYIVARFVLVEHGRVYASAPPELAATRPVIVGLDPKRSGYLVVWDGTVDLAGGLAGFHSNLVHEFFHLLQYAHNASGTIRPGPSASSEWESHWFVEASAKWAEVHFDREISWALPGVKGVRGAKGELEKQFEAFQSGRDPLNGPVGETAYQNFIWPFFITLKQSAVPGAATVGAMWRAVEAVMPGQWKASPDVIDNLLASVFPYRDNFADFALTNLNHEFSPGDPLPLTSRYHSLDGLFPDADAGANARFLPKIDRAFSFASPAIRRDPHPLVLKRLTAQYFQIDVSNQAAKQVTVDWSRVLPRDHLNVDAVVFTPSKGWEIRRLGSKTREAFCTRDKVDPSLVVFLVFSNSNHLATGGDISGEFTVEGRPLPNGECGCPAQTTGMYCVYPISAGTPGSWVLDIAGDGGFVGASSVGLRPLYWPAYTTARALLPATDPRRGWATAINDSNQAVGFVSASGGGPRLPGDGIAFWPDVRSPSPTIILDTNIGGPTIASINGKGEVVYFDPATRNFVRWKDGGYVNLGTSALPPSSGLDSVFGVNDYGHFVSQGTLWRPAPLALSFGPRALNNRDFVVGSLLTGRDTTTNATTTAPVLWRPGAGMTRLAIPPVPPFPQVTRFLYGMATGVNDRGEVVGSALYVDSRSVIPAGCPRAVMWQPDGTAVDLNSVIPFGTGVELSAAYAISSNGSILAEGKLIPALVGRAWTFCDGATAASGETSKFLLVPQEP